MLIAFGNEHLILKRMLYILISTFIFSGHFSTYQDLHGSCASYWPNQMWSLISSNFDWLLWSDMFHHDITTTFKSRRGTSGSVESKLPWRIEGRVGLERNLIASLKRMERGILNLSCQKEQRNRSITIMRRRVANLNSRNREDLWQ